MNSLFRSVACLCGREHWEKSAKLAALLSIFCWFVAALFLGSILLGLAIALAAFLAMLSIAILYPRMQRKRRAALVESSLPFVLLNIAIELNLGVSFLRCLEHAAEAKDGSAAEELQRAVDEVKGQGASIQDALRHFAERVDSVAVKRSVAQLVAAYEQGSKGKGGEPIKTIAQEILARQRIESRLFSGKLVVFSLLFVAISAIVPALFQSFAIIGSVILRMRFTALQLFLIIVALFPILDLLVLFYIRSKTPVFLRGQ